MEVIYEIGEYRIIEVPDPCYDLDDLKGDTFCPELHYNMSRGELKQQERDFEQEVIDEGVYGYIVQKWDCGIGRGWFDLDSCYGFVNTFENENHYIVAEFLKNISEGQYNE